MEKTSKGYFIVQNDRGLHTRPSTELVKCASRFRSEIFLKMKKTEANAKSILGILMLAASKGSKIRVEAIGPDADEALQALLSLAASNFNFSY